MTRFSQLDAASRPGDWRPGTLVGFALPWLLPWTALIGFGALRWTWGLAGVGATFAVALWAWTRVSRRVRSDFTEPLGELVALLDRARAAGKEGETQFPDVGHQSVRNVARRLNRSLVAALQDNQLSQAKLMSVESAFERLHAVLRTLAEGVIVVGRRGELALANPAARAFLDADSGPIADALSGPLRERVVAALENVAAGSAHEHCERVEHGARILDVGVAPITGADNTLVVITDVTKAYELARLKDEFLSSISHELRTPLTNIVAYAEILTQLTEQDSDSREFLGIIQSESKRLHRLVDNVLEYSSLESDSVAWEFEDASIDEILRGCVSAFSEVATEQEVSVELAGESERSVLVDRARLQLALANVIDNAIKFGGSGTTIRLEVCDVAEGVEVRVHDSGSGVPEDQRLAIFERLTQLGDTLVDKPAGTGMGLAICVAILNRLRGRIACESSPLGGACFVISLPIAAASPMAR